MLKAKIKQYNIVMTNKELEIARSVLNSAISGIAELSKNLDEDFVKLVELISELKGKVILSGMGKSGHIARKIASTLSSTGTPSFFVHPGEASHGDLGMVTKNDLVILLSNSGETSELKDIINYTRRYNITLAAIIRRAKSSLAEAADIKIIIPNTAEALEFDAPTTSTTMMLVLGDALALTLLEKKGFTREDFQVFHPGGRLGASFLKVKDLMHVDNEIPIAYINTNMKEVIQIITAKKFGCIAILDNAGELAGIITDGVLRRNFSSHLFEMTAGDIMVRNPITIKPNSLLVEALELMNRMKITNLLVVEHNSSKVIGVLHMHDCLRAGASPNIK